MDSGREQNYWPGFVDALSNVVLTLVFVLVVFVFALAMVSSKVEKKVQEIVHAQQTEKDSIAARSQAGEDAQALARKNEELLQQLKQATAELDKLRAQNASTRLAVGATNTTAINAQSQNLEINVDPREASKINEGTVSVMQNNENIIMNYPVSVAEADQKSMTQLGHVLDAIKKKVATRKVLLRSITGNEPYSAARRLAYYRAIGVRNYLITNGYANGSNITTTIVTPDKPTDGRVEIIYETK